MSKITIQTQKKLFPVASNLYGLFFEDINRSGDSGLYPEMLRNRSFEDSIPPERCTLSEDGVTFTTPMGWKDQFNGGEGLTRWIQRNRIAATPVPGWYADGAEMLLDSNDTLNSKRLVSLHVRFTPGGFVYNTGYMGVPQEIGKVYNFYMFAKAVETSVNVTISIESECGRIYGKKNFIVSAKSFCRYDASFVAVADDKNARLVIKSDCGGQVKFGFTSLMPADTYNGHGLRKDLMEILKAMNPRFLRFPGGCIVEGFTYETAMRFSNTIGPVWERPSHLLMWHYRTTNGLGYHEYLQMCEDLDVEPMYVFNCGLTCQVRSPEYFEGEALQAMLQDAIDAIEYAIAPADSKWGKIRAAAGHPEPFKMTYVEIGNENFGNPYFERYKMCYDTLKARFPELLYISNTHTERVGLPTEAVDEHFYSTTEFFAENIHMYDNYPRKTEGGPEIFVGEFAVTQGTAGQHYAALGEAMFMVGMERNQDIVTLASYAPLFENVHYVAWAPNLVCFDNTRAYTLPTYNAWKLFGNHRGKTVVESQVESAPIYRKVWGLPSIQAPAGTRLRNPVFNGKAVGPYQSVIGYLREEEGCCYVVDPFDPRQIEGDIRMTDYSNRPDIFNDMVKNCMVVLGDEEDEKNVNGWFEIEFLAEEGKEFSIAAFTSRLPQSLYNLDAGHVTEKWGYMELEPFRWRIADGNAQGIKRHQLWEFALSEKVPVNVRYGEYNKLRYETTESVMRVYLNDVLIQQVMVPHFPRVASVTTETDEEVIIKIVNIHDQDESVSIELDCDVDNEYIVDYCEGKPSDMNSLDNPRNVWEKRKTLSNAAATFTYVAPASSISILTLKKK